MMNDLPPGSSPTAVAPPPLRQPSTARGRGRFWMIAALVLAVLFGFSLLVHLGQVLSAFGSLAGGSYGTAMPHLEEVVLERVRASDKIAVIPVEGIIMSSGLGVGYRDMVRLIEDQLKLAAADDRVRAVLLRIDSPGGEVLAADNIADAITRFQKKTRKPVVAAMGSLAASGGYYVAAPCRWIVAHELTITGSIGVIMNGFNYRGLMNKVGVRPLIFKSGRFKDMLSGSRDLENLSAEEQELLAEERRMMQDMIDQTFRRFTNVVAVGREESHDINRNNLGAEEDHGKPLSPRWTNFVDGRILSGRDAHDIGFVDEVGDWNRAVARARKLAGIEAASLVTYRPPVDLADLLGLRLFGQAEPATVKLDLGFDPPRLKAGHLYYLAPHLLSWP
jgi:protease-4